MKVCGDIFFENGVWKGQTKRIESYGSKIQYSFEFKDADGPFTKDKLERYVLDEIRFKLWGSIKRGSLETMDLIDSFCDLEEFFKKLENEEIIHASYTREIVLLGYDWVWLEFERMGKVPDLKFQIQYALSGFRDTRFI